MEPLVSIIMGSTSDLPVMVGAIAPGKEGRESGREESRERV